MKLYLFGPMRGYKNENREAFAEARTALRDMGHDVFCPSEFSDTMRMEGATISLREFMAYDCAYILQHAQGLVGLKGWSTSKGSLAEVHLAWAIGLPVYEYVLFVRRVVREVKIVTEYDGK